MRVEVLRAVRQAQAAVRAGVPGWRDFVMLLLLVHGCGGPGEARRAAGRLIEAFPRADRPAPRSGRPPPGPPRESRLDTDPARKR